MEQKPDYSEFLRPGETLGSVPQGTLRKRKHDSKNREQKKVGAETYNSKVELTKAQARDILVERGVKNQHVLDVLLGLAEVAQEQHRIPYNKYLFTHGLRATLTSIATDKEQEGPVITDEVVPGELISRVELYLTWDYSMFRQPDVDFESFQATRIKAKSDWFFLGKELLEKDFHEKPHGAWRDFLPTFNPLTLPAKYTQEKMKIWLGEQSPVTKEYFIMASRNAYKTSVLQLLAVSLLLCLPDARVLYMSETKDFSKKLIVPLRGYFTVQNPREPNRLAQLFPEYMMRPDTGSSLTFDNPMAHLGLVDGVESSSYDSSVQGRRADLIINDDVIGEKSVTTEEQREKSSTRYMLVNKLREKGACTITLGTPWHVDDLYSGLIKRAEDGDTSIAVRIDPAWKIKPGVQATDILKLKETDVDLLFPARLDWEWMQNELKADTTPNKRVFRSQNLVEFVSEEESQIKIVFDEFTLRANVINTGIPVGETVLAIDRAFSLSARADATAITAATIYAGFGGVKSACVLDQIADRMRPSELVEEIVKQVRRFNPRWVLVESGHSDESLKQSVQLASLKYNLTIPLRFVGGSSDNKKDAKAKRFKEAELLLNDGRLKFKLGIYNGPLFEQMTTFDVSKIKSRPNDLIDSLSLILHEYKMTSGPTTVKEVDPEAADRAQQDENRLRAHAAIFGTAGQQPLTSFQKQQPVQPSHSGMRGKFAQYQKARSEALRAGRR